MKLLPIGAEIGSCEAVTISATVFPLNRFVTINWGVRVTQENGEDLTGAVPAAALTSAGVIRYVSGFFLSFLKYSLILTAMNNRTGVQC